MRKAAIWVSGILASGIIGSLIGNQLDRFVGKSHFLKYIVDNGDAAGFLAGVLAFICFRLWMTTGSKN